VSATTIARLDPSLRDGSHTPILAPSEGAFGMKIARALVLVLALGCGPIPGGSLDGEAAVVPSDWSAAMGGDDALCEIEARPVDPHSIQLECFTYDGALYVQSHRWVKASWWPVKSWAVVWIEHPDVRVRIGDALYDLRATPVDAGPERDAVLGMRGYAPIPEGIVLFRFEPRA
jgi:hypothetical protein